ncbi:MAG: cysteine--tRNA ligase [Synergistaceae bacterium]|nr:cysteine--tRNA ligase [Synergistaceae bacterium]
MTLSLYNDLTRRKEPFVPLREGEVSFYVCGPTVYDFFHIGNARPFIVFDVLRRYLEHRGYRVTYVQNFTDIDDKMINRAREMGITVSDLAERFIKAYREDADALGVRRPTHSPRATHHIKDIIALVERLVAKQHAYIVDGDVYFDVQSFPGYGKLSQQSLEDLQSGARVDVDVRKKHPLDFALWKAEKPGEPSWESPWGRGRPGWHIECSAMSTAMLGPTLDIHAGGSDLVFPHHENEIAQAEAATGQPFVKYWIHNGYLMIDQEKMSKSLGNFLTARAARGKFPPLAIRLFMLSAHYRSPINFSEEGLLQAKSAVERLRNCSVEVDEALAGKTDEGLSELTREIGTYRQDFLAQMDDDFNTAGALGSLFEAVRAVNGHIKGKNVPSREGLEAARRFLDEADAIMGIIETPSADDPDRERIEALIAERNEARKVKDFARADAIRNSLAAEGIVLEDGNQGTRWKREI